LKQFPAGCKRRLRETGNFTGKQAFNEGKKNIAIDRLIPDIEKLEENGKTVMLVAVNNVASGIIAVADTLKDTSREGSG